MADLRVNFCGVELKNPITTASGTFGFGHEYGEFFDLSLLGGVGVKGLTPTERLGNPAPRIAETPAGILNCVGLQNPGIDRFIEEQIPFLRQYDTAIIANVSGNTVEEYEGMVEKISDADVDLIEMNISCPNVKCGGMAFGTRPDMVEEVVSAAKKKAKKPLIVKLSPNVTDITEIARAAEAAGADALSLINTLLGMRINIETRKPILSNIMGGLSGPAVFPVAVRMVLSGAQGGFRADSRYGRHPHGQGYRGNAARGRGCNCNGYGYVCRPDGTRQSAARVGRMDGRARREVGFRAVRRGGGLKHGHGLPHPSRRG